MKKFILLLALLTFSFPAIAADQNVAYDRIEKSRKIRCGYGIWHPTIIKDPATGEMSGIIYEYVEALGTALGLEIEWTEEIGWGEFPTALKTGRIDVMCAGIWPSSKRARHVDFVKPIFYLPFMAYSRIDDKRFDEDISLLNNPDYTMTMTDGETSSIIAHSDFPKAKKVELPQFSEISQNFLNVVNGKADVYLNDLVSFHDFNKKNPGKLRVIPTDQPIRTFGSTIVVDDDEQKLRRMLQNATEELISKGTIETILQKYEEYPNTFYRVSKPYEEPK